MAEWNRKQAGLSLGMSRKIVGWVFAPVLLALATNLAHAIPAVPPPSQTSLTESIQKLAPAKKKSAKKPSAKIVKKFSTAALNIVSKTPNDAPDFDYQSRIEDAQELAEKQPVLPSDMVVDAQGNLSRFTWLLVVGKKAGPLTVLHMDEKGNNDQGFTVTWPIDNFINTRFTVTKPDGYIVFAQRRPVHAPSYAAKTGGYEMGVYTSYAPELDTKTMRNQGMDYLRFLQRMAYNRIKDHDVRSRVNANETVAEKIPTSMVLRLMITEHVDPLHMRYVGIEQCIHEVLITIAANRNRAYTYAKSSAGARGLSQFIADSYQMVRDNYPKALLEPNFERGMTDLSNAVLASVLHLDLELTHLPSGTLKKVSASNQHLFEFLAAGYNRNPAHVAKTYDRTKTFTGGNVSFENKMYVRIQSWVGKFLDKEFGIT
jgi:hypothetical protein